MENTADDDTNRDSDETGQRYADLDQEDRDAGVSNDAPDADDQISAEAAD